MKLKPHPNSPKGKVGRAERKRNALAYEQAWASARADQVEYARRPDRAHYVRPDCGGHQGAPKEPRKRGATMFATSKPTVAKAGPGVMRPTFVRPAEGGGFEYGWIKVHRWTPHRDKSIVKGRADTYAEAARLSAQYA